MSDDGFTRWGSYFYPGTDVLINKRGLRDPEALKAFEYDSAAMRSFELRDAGVTGNGSLAHLQAVHKYLFQDTYEWAGQVRDVTIAKGNSKFEKPENIPEAAERLHARLVKADYFKGMDKSEFVQHLSTYYADLNRLHPFREGNGRATREVAADIAHGAGYTLDQAKIDNAKGLWNAAAAKSMSGEINDLQKIFSEAIRPTRAVALERLPREQALASHPELKPVYAVLDAVAKQLESQHPGNAKAQAHFLAHKRSEIVRQLDGGDTRILAKPEPAKVVPERFDSAWQKAQAYANEKITDPKAREAFLTHFVERMRAVDKQTPPPARKPEPTIGR